MNYAVDQVIVQAIKATNHSKCCAVISMYSIDSIFTGMLLPVFSCICNESHLCVAKIKFCPEKVFKKQKLHLKKVLIISNIRISSTVGAHKQFTQPVKVSLNSE